MFKAVSDPLRLRLLSLIASREGTAGSLALTRSYGAGQAPVPTTSGGAHVHELAEPRDER